MNAIIYLLNNAEKDILCFRNSIQFLNQNYLFLNQCDIICFYEKDFPAQEIEYIESVSAKKIKFVKIKFEVPQYPHEISSKIKEYVPHPDFPSALGFSMGYRQMCKFFSGEIFKNENLEKYEYVWRLDTDSYILSPIQYDVFNRMKENNSKYGYINIQFDHPKMTIGLLEESIKYFNLANFSPLIDLTLDEHKNRVFYTNFEIFDMKWFRGLEYQNFYNFINESGGIFIYRWGDHCIRYIAVKSMILGE